MVEKFGSELSTGARVCLLSTLFAFYCFLRCFISPVACFLLCLRWVLFIKKKTPHETIDLDLYNTLHFTNGIHADLHRLQRIRHQ